jgi:hypothetical protein
MAITIGSHGFLYGAHYDSYPAMSAKRPILAWEYVYNRRLVSAADKPMIVWRWYAASEALAPFSRKRWFACWNPRRWRGMANDGPAEPRQTSHAPRQKHRDGIHPADVNEVPHQRDMRQLVMKRGTRPGGGRGS